ncbi:hypothetical protein IJ818_00630 [bacterium]|nr:hypothetical protein [bacterium]
MKVNSIQSVMPFLGAKEVKKENKISQNTTQTSPQQLAKMPSAETFQAMNGIKPRTKNRPTPIVHSNYDAAKAIADAGVMLSKEDFKNVKNVLSRGDEQTSNVMMQLSLIKSGDIEPSTVSHYWETGKMNDNLAKDLDMVYEARKAGKNPADVYVPTVKSQKEGNAKTKIGDVFKVADEDKIYVKTSKKDSKQLDMDKDMFVKLFPPAKRFTTQQQSIGDCYLVSTLNTVMQNPKARVALYDAFHQNGKDVTVKFQNGYGEYKYENAEVPKDRVQKYSLKGSTGIRILEDAYGLDSVNKADVKFREIMGQKIEAKKAEVANSTGEQKVKAQKSLEGHEKRLNDYIEAKKDPSRTIVVCRDDNYYNIYYEEDENGLKFADLKNDPDNKSDKFHSAADFYRGALGGYNFEVLERMGFGGFRQYNLDLEEKTVTPMLKKDNFNEDFIMTGGTRAGGSRVENPVAKSAGIYGFHAYTLEPHKDEKGELKMRCTNPWNTSYDADISYKDFLKYYDSVSIIDVNSYGKKLPLEKQPYKYDKDGAVVGDNKNDGEVIWFKNGGRKPVLPHKK